MNPEERRRNSEYIHAYDVYGDRSLKVLEVDTHRVTYQGKPYKKLSAFERRKFDNMLFIDNSRERIKTRYI